MNYNNTTEFLDILHGGTSIISSDNLKSAGMLSLTNNTLLNHVNVTEHSEHQRHIRDEFIEQLVSYSVLIISIFGVFGNIFCLTIMSRLPFSEMVHSIMCASLAFVDLVFMIFQLNISVIRIITGKHLAHINSPLCKFGINFSFLCMHLDAWILVGLSLQRIVAVFRPLHAAQIITKFKIKLLLALTSIFFILFNGESSVRYDFVTNRHGNTSINTCEPVYFYGLPRKVLVIKDQVSSLLASFIPLIIITMCNVALLIKLARQKQNQNELGVIRNDTEKIRTNRMIITVMAAFILLLSPTYIYVIVLNTNDYNDPVLRILSLGAILNPAINFYLYCLSASLFRNAVKNMFPFTCLSSQGVSIQ